MDILFKFQHLISQLVISKWKFWSLGVWDNESTVFTLRSQTDRPKQIVYAQIKNRSEWSAYIQNVIISPLLEIQLNLNSSNTDGSLTMANSNSFLSPFEILPTAQENKYLGKFYHLIRKLYVVCIH